MIDVILPATWSSKRLKYLATYNDEVLPESTDEEAEIDYVEISGVSLSRGVEQVERISFGQAPSRARRKVRSGDILISTVRTYLRAIAKVDEASPDLIASTGFCVVRPDREEVDSGYLGWAAKSEPFVSEVVSRSVGVSYPAINASELVTIEMPLPPLETQRRIAQFLDEKTARIDGLIEKKRALLDRLAEKRQALITRAVTKGLNPDAPMKPSGIDWLGDIPAHWACKRLRFTMKTNPSKREITLSDDQIVSFVPMEAVGEYGGLKLDTEKELGEVNNGYTYFADNDVVVAKITPCFENGKSALAKGLKNGVAFGTTELHVLRGNKDLLSEYLFYIATSHPFAKIGESEMYGSGGQKRVPESFLKDFRIGLPSVDEQFEIIEYMESVNRRSDLQAKKTFESIERLEEYRAALITAAVTGQIGGLQ